MENLIYEIRGKQVMLDSDLARLYGVETKRINEAVKNNPDKFPERFSFKLYDEESVHFLVENFDQKTETRGGKYKNPRVFTEQGVMMLATILKSKIAVETTIRIMDAFVAMRKYVSTNLLEQKYVNKMVLEDHERIGVLEETLDKFEEKRAATEIYFDGQIYDAYSKILEIFQESKKELVVVDAYADKTMLDIVRRLKVRVKIVVKTKSLLSKQDIDKYNEQYGNLEVVYDDSFHDRYFILDNAKVFHCGASVNRIGYKTFSITEVADDEVKNLLIEKIKNKPE